VPVDAIGTALASTIGVADIAIIAADDEGTAPMENGKKSEGIEYFITSSRGRASSSRINGAIVMGWKSHRKRRIIV
jgi:hypothetical protein